MNPSPWSLSSPPHGACLAPLASRWAAGPNTAVATADALHLIWSLSLESGLCLHLRLPLRLHTHWHTPELRLEPGLRPAPAPTPAHALAYACTACTPAPDPELELALRPVPVRPALLPCSCLDANPKQRPEFSEVLSRLDAMHAAFLQGYDALELPQQPPQQPLQHLLQQPPQPHVALGVGAAARPHDTCGTGAAAALQNSPLGVDVLGVDALGVDARADDLHCLPTGVPLSHIAASLPMPPPTTPPCSMMNAAGVPAPLEARLCGAQPCGVADASGPPAGAVIAADSVPQPHSASRGGAAPPRSRVMAEYLAALGPASSTGQVAAALAPGSSPAPTPA
eukprot:364221-Chlamydomonas_euryale.AAC.6